MKLKSYITTIQWGEGMHYIEGTQSTLLEAQQAREGAQKSADLLRANRTCGARPCARIWKLVEDSKHE